MRPTMSRVEALAVWRLHGLTDLAVQARQLFGLPHGSGCTLWWMTLQQRGIHRPFHGSIASRAAPIRRRSWRCLRPGSPRWRLLRRNRRIGCGEQAPILGQTVVQVIGVANEDVPVPPLLAWTGDQMVQAASKGQRRGERAPTARTAPSTAVSTTPRRCPRLAPKTSRVPMDAVGDKGPLARKPTAALGNSGLASRAELAAVRLVIRRPGRIDRITIADPIPRAPGIRINVSKEKPGWMSACRERPSGITGDASPAARRASKPAGAGDQDWADQGAAHHLDSRGPDDSQAVVVVRCEHDFAPNCLADKGEIHERGQRAEEKMRATTDEMDTPLSTGSCGVNPVDVAMTDEDSGFRR